VLLAGGLGLPCWLCSVWCSLYVWDPKTNHILACLGLLVTWAHDGLLYIVFGDIPRSIQAQLMFVLPPLVCVRNASDPAKEGGMQLLWHIVLASASLPIQWSVMKLDIHDN